ncbi:MAG: hypothetical protein ACYDCL_10160 [Myxococcales bacterium]
MVNNHSSTPGSSRAIGTPAPPSGVGSIPPGSSGGSSTGSGSSAAGGASSSGAPVATAVAASRPAKGLRKAVTAMASGFGTSFPSGATIMANGQSMSQTSILSALQAGLLLYAAVDQAVAQAKQSRLPLQAALPGLHTLVQGLRAALIAYFGKGNPVLEAFGISAAKPRQLTAEQKAARSAKAKATRSLRGTAGKRQKADVKFVGTANVQTQLSGVPAAGGNPSSAGAPTSAPGNTPSGSSGTGTTSGA